MNPDLFDLKQTIKEAGEIVAMSMVKILNPIADEIDYTEACRIATRRWIDHHDKQGHLSHYRRGRAKNSKKYYSRTDIYALKKAESEQAKIL